MLNHITQQFDRRTLIVLGIAFLLGVTLTFMGMTFVSASDNGDVVVTVNGQAITKDEFYSRLEEEAGEAILGQMITEMIIVQSEQTRGITITDEEIEAEIESIKAQFGTEEAFNQALEIEGISMERLQYEIRLNLLVQKLSRHGVTVTDEEVKQYFDENKAALDEPESLRVRHILVDTEAEAKDIYEQLKDGADFAALARDKSIDTVSGQNGGDIGLIYPDSAIVEPFKEAAFKLDVGEFSEPVESMYGWHIILVDAKHEAREASLDELGEEIRDFLISQKARPIYEIIDELFEEADIQVLWSKYQSILDW